MEKKRSHKLKIVFLVIAGVFLTVFLIPMHYSLSDGGSTGYFSLLGYGYDIRNCHELYLAGKDIDGTTYSYSPTPMRYNVGTRIKIFGLTVFDNTHPDPPEVGQMKYEEEVKELISYYNSNRVGDVELSNIYVSEREGLRYVNLYFHEVDKLEVSDEVIKVIIDYLEEHPDSFLYDDFDVSVSARHSELVEKTLTSETWKMYEADYILGLPEKAITELRLSPAMIPDAVPAGHDFAEVGKISFLYVKSVDADEETVIRSIYPDAEIITD